ncbi:MAG: extracellular solute-binding protein, partial [Clostridiales bacterium]|nr:extracellular solute-binding protein [Clostridiales bacterium]
GTMAGLTACGDDGTIELTIWGSAAQEQTFKEMAEQFKAANPDKKYKIKVGISEEDMAYSNVSKDPSAAADVYCYSNDQLIPLLRVGALARIGGSSLETIKANNTEDSVKAATLVEGGEEKVYGYPYASDNGYFMIYDKSVVSDAQAGRLEDIIAACAAAQNKKIAWAIDVPWYTAGWFFSFGCSYNVEYDERHVEKSITIDFDNENGVKASKAIQKLTSNKNVFAGKGTNNSTITTGFATGTTAVAVTGTWIAKNIKETLGDNYGVAKLPTVTLDGEPVQLKSFKGYKMFGVNPHCGTDKIGEAHKLAAFLSSASMQRERFEKHMVGPTNIEITDLVSGDETFIALNAQNEFAVEQTAVPTSFWEPLKEYGLNLMDGLVDEAGTEGAGYTYEARLAYMVNKIKNTITTA